MQATRKAEVVLKRANRTHHLRSHALNGMDALSSVVHKTAPGNPAGPRSGPCAAVHQHGTHQKVHFKAKGSKPGPLSQVPCQREQEGTSHFVGKYLWQRTSPDVCLAKLLRNRAPTRMSQVRDFALGAKPGETHVLDWEQQAAVWGLEAERSLYPYHSRAISLTNFVFTSPHAFKPLFGTLVEEWA